MKHIVSKNKFEGKICQFLYLENTEDAVAFNSFNSLLLAKQSIAFWIAFKSQKFRNTPNDYLAHEGEPYNPIARLLALKMTLSTEESISLLDFCNMSDEMINDLSVSILKGTANEIVRINLDGGVLVNAEIEEGAEDISLKQMENFLLHRDINYDFVIRTRGAYLSKWTHYTNSFSDNYLNSSPLDRKEVTEIYFFNKRTRMFTESDYVNFFASALDNGLEFLFYKIDTQQIKQTEDLLRRLEEAVTLTGKNLTILFKIREYDVKTTEHIKSDKLKIYFIK